MFSRNVSKHINPGPAISNWCSPETSVNTSNQAPQFRTMFSRNISKPISTHAPQFRTDMFSRNVSKHISTHAPQFRTMFSRNISKHLSTQAPQFRTVLFSRNVSKHLSTQAPQRPRGGKASPTPRHKPELSHGLQNPTFIPQSVLWQVHRLLQRVFPT